MGKGRRSGPVVGSIIFQDGGSHRSVNTMRYQPQTTCGAAQKMEQYLQRSRIDQLRKLAEEREKKRKDAYQRYTAQQKLQVEAIQTLLAEAEADKTKHNSQATSVESLPVGSLEIVSSDHKGTIDLEFVNQPHQESVERSTIHSNNTNTTDPSIGAQPDINILEAPYLDVKPQLSVESTLVGSLGNVSDQEKLIIAHRLKLTQIRLSILERQAIDNKLDYMLDSLSHLTEEEATAALEKFAGNEFDAIDHYTSWENLRNLRIQIARAKTPNSARKRKRHEISEMKEEKGDGNDEEFVSKLPTKRRKTRSSSEPGMDPDKCSFSVSKPISNSAVARKRIEEATTSASDSSDDQEDEPNYHDHQIRKKKHITVKKLQLDDAIAQGSMEGWSSARIRAWSLLHENPNAYYYRFNNPGEVQRKGKWTQEERERFFARMAEVGVDGQWGIFAKEIPGRVGYQCANYYRQMIQSGEIHDPRYYTDEQGAHFMFSGKKLKSSGDTEVDDKGLLGKLTHSKNLQGADIYLPKILKLPSQTKFPSSVTNLPNASSSAPPSPASMDSSVPQTLQSARTNNASTKPQKIRTPSIQRDAAESDGRCRKRNRRKEDIDTDYRPSSAYARERLSQQVEEAIQSRKDSNPLPGFKDAITNTELVEPALSPYGHVLSYETWIRCLRRPKNTCPLTKKPLNKRDLIRLTWDNIEEHRSKIIPFMNQPSS